MTKNVGLNQDSNQGPSRTQKKGEFFVQSSTTEPQRHDISCEQNIVAKLVNSNLIKQRNKQRFKFNHRPLWYLISFEKCGLMSLRVNKILQSLPRNHFEYLSENVFVKCPYKIAIIEPNYTLKQKIHPYLLECGVMKINISDFNKEPDTTYHFLEPTQPSRHFKGLRITIRNQAILILNLFDTLTLLN